MDKIKEFFKGRNLLKEAGEQAAHFGWGFVPIVLAFWWAGLFLTISAGVISTTIFFIREFKWQAPINSWVNTGLDIAFFVLGEGAAVTLLLIIF